MAGTTARPDSELPSALPTACCLPLQAAVKIVETRIDNIKAAPAQSSAAESEAAAPSTSAAAAGSNETAAAGSSAEEAAEAAGPSQQGQTPATGELLHLFIPCSMGSSNLLHGH